MDLNQAILFGQLISAAYAVPASDLTNRVGDIITAGVAAAQTSFAVLTSLYANDLATEINVLRGNDIVSIGLVLQSPAGDAVIAVRGTEGIYEWVHDASFFPVPCPFLSGAGRTEDGFTTMYMSMSTASTAKPPSCVAALAALPWKIRITSLTICGHSLGGALATLLALDVAAHANDPIFKNPTVYTYASPRTGDSDFANLYNHILPKTFRIANRIDLVPKLPLPPLYEHVDTLFDLNPIKFGFPPQLLVKPEVPCEHFLTSYLHLLSLLTGGAPLPLDAACVPPAGIHLPPIR
jgi:Lipase (class 3)